MEVGVYGGYPIKITAAPWMAHIKYRVVENGQKFSYNCGGSIIDDVHILTAAHCVYDSNEPKVDLKNVSQYEIRIGSADRRIGGDIYKVAELHPHPQYDNKEFYHDMAIIKLTKKIQFNKKTVQKVRLDNTKGNYRAGTDVRSMGWGENPENPETTNLYRVNLKVVSYEKCTEEWGGSVEVYQKRFVCAYGPNKGDVCQGDSGGPLLKDNIQIGTVSFGSTCPQEGSQPGLYSKVADNLAWINSVISGGKKGDESCES